MVGDHRSGRRRQRGSGTPVTDVFDQRQRNGAIAKSDAFQRRISEARSVLKGIGVYDGANLKENHNG